MNLVDKIEEFRQLDNRHSEQYVRDLKHNIITEYGVTYDIFETIHHNLIYGKPIQYEMKLK